MTDTSIPHGRRTQTTLAIAEMDILWLTAGLSCDGDTVSITAAMQPSIEDIVLGAIPGLPKAHLYNPVLAYDTARVLVEGLVRAPILTGEGVKTGLERIRFMPSTTGGPRTHIACSPHEHGMFRGDWLLYGRVRNGKLEFEGLFDPW